MGCIGFVVIANGVHLLDITPFKHLRSLLNGEMHVLRMETQVRGCGTLPTYYLGIQCWVLNNTSLLFKIFSVHLSCLFLCHCFCPDINECEEMEHGCDHCMNLQDGFECYCPDGYELGENEKACMDIDECEEYEYEEELEDGKTEI